MITERSTFQVTDANGLTASKDIDFVYSEYPISHYWRLHISANNFANNSQPDLDGGFNTPNVISLAQIALRAEPGGPNQCVVHGGTASESAAYNVPGGVYGSLDAWLEQFKDGQSGDYWLTGNTASPGWWASFQFAAGISVPCAELALTTVGYSGRAPMDFSLQTSPDGAAWSDVAQFSGITDWALGVSHTFAIPPLT